MKLALKEAEKGRGFVSPNPVVGACVVKNGKLISKGHHAAFGGPHAEVEAIRKAGRKTKGATLYVTLEPCSTYGKTPPCTEEIKAAKFSRVVIAVHDPNPKHGGRAVEILRKSGIKVVSGILEAEARKQNEAFFKWVRTGLPLVTLKMAQSLDGKTALASGESRWISGPQARNWVHALRWASDGVLVGKNTVLNDNPRLTVRLGGPVRQPWRIVLDRRAELCVKMRIFHQGGPTILACGRQFLNQALKKFSHTNVAVLPLGLRRGRLNLKDLVQRLGELGLTSLLVEGGGETAWSFLEAGLVDRVKWIVAAKLIGGRESKTSIEGAGVKSLQEAVLLKKVTVTPLGNDLLLEGEVS